MAHARHGELQTSGGGLATTFAPSGPIVRVGGALLGLRAAGVGYGAALSPLRPVTPATTRNQVVYRRGLVREWYRNGPLGLEQGFNITGRPRAGAGWLTITERVAGGLVARRSGNQVVFARAGGGRALLRLGGLAASDARGRSLRTEFALDGTTLLLRIRDAGARYPVSVDPMLQQGPELAPTGETGVSSVALSSDGNTALIGGGNGAWVFVRSGSAWAEQTELISSSGGRVALSGDGNTALISDPRAGTWGAVWVFTRSGSTWSQQAELVYPGSPDTGGASFGASVAVSGDGNTALISGYDYDDSDVQPVLTTRAWLFTRSGSTWTWTWGWRKPVPNPDAGALWSVALSGDGNTALIGDPSRNSASISTRSGSSWTQGATLSGAARGVALSADGTTALIGGAGAASIFTGSGSSWTQGATLSPDDEVGYADFGSGVALSADGTTALIGGPAENGSLGAAWVFARSGSTWTQAGSKLTPNDGETGPGPHGHFGASAALSSDGGTALVGGEGGAWPFLIDTVTPAALDLVGPANGVQNLPQAPPTFSWHEAGGSVDHYELWIDGVKDQDVSTSACSGGTCSAQASAGLADGSHRWLVREVDTAGNVGSSDTWGFTVDAAPPAAFGLLGPANGTATQTAQPTFSWAKTSDSGTGVDHYELRIDGTKDQDVPTSACAAGACSMQASAALAEGSHTWLVKAVDGNGNVRASNETWSLTIDTTPPASFSLVSPSDGAYVGPGPTLVWNRTTDSGSGVDHFELWIDGNKDQSLTSSACSSTSCSATPSGARPDGSHTWFVKAVDGAGNSTSTPTRTFIEDMTPPAAFSNIAPANGSRFDNAKPTLLWTSSSDGGSGLAGYRVMIDGKHSGPDLPATSTSYAPTSNLADGTHSWQILAIDNVGNVEQGPTWQFVVDTARPNAAITTTHADVLTGTAVTFDASGSSDPDGAAIVKYEWDPEGTGAFTSSGASSTFQHTYSAPGTYQAYVRVTNEVGLSDTASVTVRVHLAPPSGPVGMSIDNAAQVTNDPDVTLNVVWPAFTDTVLVSNDGGFANAQRFPVSTAIPWTLSSAGSERLPKIVYLRFGNSTQTFTDDIILDTVAPTVSAATAGPVTGGYRVSVQASDDNSGVAHMQVTTNTGNPGPVLPFATSTTYRGSTAPTWVRVLDAAGNRSAWHAIAGPPTISGLSPDAGSTAGGHSVTITGTGLVPGAVAKFSSTGHALATTFVSGTQLRVSAPAHPTGVVHVFVITPAGTSRATNSDLYAFGAPTVSALSPAAGPSGGGRTVKVTGSGFAPGATVKFGSSGRALRTTFVSGTQLKVNTPAHAAGTVDVFVTTPGGISRSSRSDLYAFGRPAVSSLSPSTGSTVGGAKVKIDGSGFVSGATAQFGPHGRVLTTTFVSRTQLKVVTPANAIGAVHVYVSTAAGTSTATRRDLFAYGAAG